MERLGLIIEHPLTNLLSIPIALTVLQDCFFVLSLLLSESLSPATCVLYDLGGAFGPDIMLHLRLYRVFSPFILHAGILNAIMCTYIQLKLWPSVIAYYGRARFILILVLSIGVGTVAAILFDQYAVIAGAPIGMFGVLGAKGAEFVHKIKTNDIQRLEKLAFYFTYVFIPFALTSLWPHSTIAGALFSLATGFCLGLIVVETEFQGTLWKLAFRSAGLITAIVILLWMKKQWIELEYLDCEFLPYVSKDDSIHFSGELCETFCSEY